MAILTARSVATSGASQGAVSKNRSREFRATDDYYLVGQPRGDAWGVDIEIRSDGAIGRGHVRKV